MENLERQVAHIYRQFVDEDGSITKLRKNQQYLIDCMDGNGVKGMVQRMKEVEDKVEFLNKSFDRINIITNFISKHPKLSILILFSFLVAVSVVPDGLKRVVTLMG